MSVLDEVCEVKTCCWTIKLRRGCFIIAYSSMVPLFVLFILLTIMASDEPNDTNDKKLEAEPQGLQLLHDSNMASSGDMGQNNLDSMGIQLKETTNPSTDESKVNDTAVENNGTKATTSLSRKWGSTTAFVDKLDDLSVSKYSDDEKNQTGHDFGLGVEMSAKCLYFFFFLCMLMLAASVILLIGTIERNDILIAIYVWHILIHTIITLIFFTICTVFALFNDSYFLVFCIVVFGIAYFACAYHFFLVTNSYRKLLKNHKPSSSRGT